MRIKSIKKPINNSNDLCEGTVIYADTDSIAEDSLLRVSNENQITVKDVFNEHVENDFKSYKINQDGREFVFPSDLKLPYYDEEYNEVKRGKVQYIERHLIKKSLFRLRMKSGKYIDVTEDHSCMVLGSDGKLKEVKPKDLSKGDKVISIK